MTAHTGGHIASAVMTGRPVSHSLAIISFELTWRAAGYDDFESYFPNDKSGVLH